MSGAITVGIRLKAEGAGIVGEVNRTEGALDGLGAATKRTHGETGRLTQALHGEAAALGNAQSVLSQLRAAKLGLGDASAALTTKLRAAGSAIGSNLADLLHLRAAKLGASDAATTLSSRLQALIAKLRATDAAGKDVGRTMRQVAPQFTDIVTQVAAGQNPFQIFIQQGGQLKDVFGGAGPAARALGGYIAGLITPLNMVIAAAGLLALAWYKGHKESAELQKQITLTGNYAGMTEGRFNALTESIHASGTTTIGKAREIALALLASGQIGAGAFDSITRTAAEFARVAGVDGAKAAQTLAQAMADPAKGAIELNRQYHFLTAAQYDHIRALQESGDLTGAQVELAKRFGERLSEVRENLGWLENVAHGVGSAFSTMWDKALNIGREQTLEDKIKSLQYRLMQLRSQINTGWIKPGGVGERNLLAEIDQANRDLLAKNTAAERAAMAAAGEQEKIDARGRWSGIQKSLKPDLGLQDRIKEIERLGRVLAVPQAEIAALITLEQQRSAGHKQQSQAANAAAQTEAQLQDLLNRSLGINASYNDQVKLLDDARKRGRLSAEEYGRVLAWVNLHETEAGRARLQQVEAQRQQLQSSEKLTESAEWELATHGLTESAILRLTASRKRDEAAELARQLAQNPGDDLLRQRIDMLQKEAAMIDRRATAKRGLEDIGNAESARKQASEVTREWTDAAQRIAESWQEMGERIATGLSSAFGQSGQLIGGIVKGFTGYQKAMQGIEIRRREALNSEKLLGKQSQVNRLAATERAGAEIGMYGDLSAAAKGFFKEGSDGYALLSATEKAFRLYEMAMAVDSAMQKIALSESVTAAKLAGDATQTSSMLSGAVQQIAAWFGIGQASATAGVAAQASGDPYTAWGRMAAMAAVMAGLGFAVSGISGGGGSRDYAAERQKSAGTGSVLGDATARSESISKSIEALQQAAELSVSIETAMLRNLQAIAASMGGLAALTVKSGIATNGVASTVPTGFNRSGLGDFMAGQGGLGKNLLGGLLLGPLGLVPAAAGVLGKLDPTGLVSSLLGKLGGLFGTKTTVNDTGIGADRQTLSQVLQQGWQGFNYATVTQKKKVLGVSTGSSTSERRAGLDSELTQQISMVIGNMAGATREAAALLGEGGSAFEQRLSSFVVDIGRISLKGLSGKQIEEQFAAVFGKLGDDMAKTALPNLIEYQRVGEGALETLSRLAGEYQTVDVLLGRLGKTSQSAFGMVGMASMKMREQLIEAAGGLDALTEGTQTFWKHFFTEDEQKVRRTAEASQALRSMGGAFANFDLNANNAREQFKRLVLGIDLSTESGAQLYAQAIRLAPAIDELVKGFDQAAEGWKAMGGDLKKWLSDLRFGDLATTSTQDRYGAAKSEFEGLLAKARGGDLEAAQGLSGSAERLLGLGRDMYASGADYAALYQQTTSALDLVAQMGLNGGTDPTTVAVKESNDWLRKIWNGIEKMAETGVAQIRQQAAISERASEEQGQTLRTLDEIKTETKRTRQAGRGVLA